MANNTSKPEAQASTTSAPASITLTIPADWSTEAAGHKLTASDLTNPKTVSFLLSNGFIQAISDAGAFALKSKGVLTPFGQKTEAEQEAIKAESRAKKYQAILDGTVGAPRASAGPKVAGVEKFIRDEALKDIRATAKLKGKELPHKMVDGKKVLDAERMDKLVALVISAKPEITARGTAMFEASQSNQTSAVEVDGLDGLFDDKPVEAVTTTEPAAA